MYKIIEGVDVDTTYIKERVSLIIRMKETLSKNEERNKIILDTINNNFSKMLIVSQFKSHINFIRDNICKDDVDFILMFYLSQKILFDAEFLNWYDSIFFVVPFHKFSDEIICFEGTIIEIKDNNPIFKRWISKHKFYRNLRIC